MMAACMPRRSSVLSCVDSLSVFDEIPPGGRPTAQVPVLPLNSNTSAMPGSQGLQAAAGHMIMRSWLSGLICLGMSLCH